jgi:hypothetical protein
MSEPFERCKRDILGFERIAKLYGNNLNCDGERALHSE